MRLNWLLFAGGLVSYAIDRPTPEKNDWSENMDDISYDGTVDGHQMTKGLGQLTDGIITDNRTSPNATRFGIRPISIW